MHAVISEHLLCTDLFRRDLKNLCFMFHVPPQTPSNTNALSRLYLPGRTHVLIPYLTRALSPREDPGLVPIEEIVFVDARLRAEDRRKQALLPQ